MFTWKTRLHCLLFVLSAHCFGQESGPLSLAHLAHGEQDIEKRIEELSKVTPDENLELRDINQKKDQILGLLRVQQAQEWSQLLQKNNQELIPLKDEVIQLHHAKEKAFDAYFKEYTKLERQIKSTKVLLQNSERSLHKKLAELEEIRVKSLHDITMEEDKQQKALLLAKNDDQEKRLSYQREFELVEKQNPHKKSLFQKAMKKRDQDLLNLEKINRPLISKLERDIEKIQKIYQDVVNAFKASAHESESGQQLHRNHLQHMLDAYTKEFETLLVQHPKLEAMINNQIGIHRKKLDNMQDQHDLDIQKFHLEKSQLEVEKTKMLDQRIIELKKIIETKKNAPKMEIEKMILEVLHQQKNKNSKKSKEISHPPYRVIQDFTCTSDEFPDLAETPQRPLSYPYIVRVYTHGDNSFMLTPPAYPDRRPYIKGIIGGQMVLIPLPFTREDYWPFNKNGKKDFKIAPTLLYLQEVEKSLYVSFESKADLFGDGKTLTVIINDYNDPNKLGINYQKLIFKLNHNHLLSTKLYHSQDMRQERVEKISLESNQLPQKLIIYGPPGTLPLYLDNTDQGHKIEKALKIAPHLNLFNGSLSRNLSFEIFKKIFE